jgi:hypothetical protein
MFVDMSKEFKADGLEAAKVELSIVEAKSKTTLISGTELLKLFDRTSYAPKSGESLYLKIITNKIPAIYNGVHLTAGERTCNDKYINVTAAGHYGYLYLNYTSIEGVARSGYFPLDYKFEMVDKDHKEYPEVNKIYETLIIKSLSDRLHHSFKIGSDPEIFVEDGDGKLIPAFKFLPGKDAPAYTPSQSYNFNGYGGCPMYWDGYQAEFTTKANTCLGHHGDSIAAGMRGVYDAARKVYPNAKLSLRSVFHLAPEELANAADEHVAFGCMPSKNVYGLKVEMPPARMVPFRSAGGHIHFGVGKAWHQFAEPMVKALDAILGVACVSLFAEFDDPNRRRLYGLPGEYRTPEHGIEYRPLSNAWLCHPMIMNLVIDLSRKALMFGKNGFMKYWDATEEETINCIINCDVEASHRILARNKVAFKQMLKASYYSSTDAELELLYNVFVNGIRSAINDPNDFVTNWKLQVGWTPHSGSRNEPNVAKYMRERIGNANYKM